MLHRTARLLVWAGQHSQTLVSLLKFFLLIMMLLRGPTAAGCQGRTSSSQRPLLGQSAKGGIAKTAAAEAKVVCMVAYDGCYSSFCCVQDGVQHC